MLLLLATAARADSDPESDPFELSLTGSVGIPKGNVQVRENERLGTHLRFQHDLGIDTSESLALTGTYHFTPSSALKLEFDTNFLYGSTRLDQDVFFNGARLQAGTKLESDPDF
jgi:hypothetical protein